MRVVDLGCGTGVLTQELHQTLAAASTLGIDSSDNMMAKSAQFAGDGVSFRLADIGTFGDGPYDLLFSNAALHWLPDHRSLLPRLSKLIAPGGQLAVQVPANHDHPAYVIADEVAREAPFADLLDGYTRGAAVLDPGEYAELLHGLGYKDLRVGQNIYGHELRSVDEVVQWVRGAMLTDYERKMPAESFTAYVDRYSERLHERLGDPRPYYFGFKRILISARR